MIRSIFHILLEHLKIKFLHMNCKRLIVIQLTFICFGELQLIIAHKFMFLSDHSIRRGLINI